MEHNSESTGAMAWFERELSAGVADEHIDCQAVEARLFGRIQALRELGSLAVLKCNESAPEEVFDRVEKSLMRRIQEHEEYDVPVDAAINTDHEIAGQQWERIAGSIDERISEMAKLESWEQLIKADEVVSLGTWERIEEKLLRRIERDRKLDELARQPVWASLFVHFWTIRRYAAVGVIAIMFGMAMWAGWGVYEREFRPVPTLVYQAQGPAAIHFESQRISSEQFSSVPGGVVTVVNRHGYIELRNGSRVAVKKTTAAAARYEVELSQAGTETAGRGQVRFFVEKRNSSGSFIVATRDYEISVMGTYFSVEPDHAGRMVTHVFEGAVRIRFQGVGDTLLTAGQTIRFSKEQNAYVISAGGPVLDRMSIPRVPSMNLLQDFRLLRIGSSPEGADVRINGTYCGATPLLILQPPGVHQVSISREGHAVTDTVINVGVEQAVYQVQTVLASLPSTVARNPVHEMRRSVTESAVARIKPLPTKSPEPFAGESMYRMALEAVQEGRWSDAVALYRTVCNDPAAPSLRRQDAHFAVGRIFADRLSRADDARQEFLMYLALYPDGFFAGEAWLRMAELEMSVDVDKSIEYYLRYLEKYPRHHRRAEIQHRVGLLYLQRKHYAQAIDMLNQSLSSLVHEDRELRKSIYLNLHKALMESGDQAQAQRVMQEFLVQNR